MILKDLRYSRLAPRKQVLSFTAPGLERTVYDTYAKEPEVQRPKSAYFSKTFETVPFTAYKYKHPGEQSNSKKSQTKNWFPVRVRRMATEYQLVTAWEDGRKQQVVLESDIRARMPQRQMGNKRLLFYCVQGIKAKKFYRRKQYYKENDEEYLRVQECSTLR